MGIAVELISLSAFMVHMEQPDFTQAVLRRTVSTAYYAVFHLLTSDAAERWGGTLLEKGELERAFSHGAMRTVSGQFSKGQWKYKGGQSASQPRMLREVASSFVELQVERHLADYDNQKIWSLIEAENIVARAIEVFHNWEAIRAEPEAGTYLLAMLLGKPR